jgi:hypothetical protein
MGLRQDHEDASQEILGSYSPLIEQTFIDRKDAMRLFGPHHRVVGHNGYSRNLCEVFGRRDEWELHMIMDDEFDSYEGDREENYIFKVRMLNDVLEQNTTKNN